jgi:hypothetical protein
MKQLKFKCRECGCTQLEEIQLSALVISRLSFISPTGDHRYEDNPTIEDYEDFPGIWYQCVECGAVLEDGGMEINDCVWLAEYLGGKHRRKGRCEDETFMEEPGQTVENSWRGNRKGGTRKTKDQCGDRCDAVHIPEDTDMDERVKCEDCGNMFTRDQGRPYKHESTNWLCDNCHNMREDDANE